MLWWQALAVAFMYYFSDSPWPFGEGYYVLQRPVVAGFLVGLIMGQPVQGTIIGATINLVYLGHLNVGGSMPSDMALAGYLGTAIALSAKVDAQTALAIAVPLGIIGTIVWLGRMSISSIFAHWADKYAEDGNAKGVRLMNWLPAQTMLFIFKVPVVFLAAIYGGKAVEAFLAAVGHGNILHAFSVVGGMLPALGIALNLKAILKGQTFPFLLVGFLLSAYFKLDIIAISLFGLVFALIYLQTKGGETNEQHKQQRN